MTATNQDFDLYEGTELDIVFSLVDSAGAPVDATGWDFTWTLGDKLVTKTTPSEIEIAADQITVHVLRTDTGSILANGVRCQEIAHQLQATENANTPRTLPSEGICHLKKNLQNT